MKKNTLIWSVVAVVFVALVVWLIVTPGKTGKLDSLATCIKDSGATFYGAFWCPHCQATKALFGSSQKLLPYIECSNPDGQSQNAVCNAAKIESYPTWQFRDGSRITGEQTLKTLAEKTNCPLPQ
ncbi:hypothetical protein KW800_02860 [Candidatus Parcubacteria bacterium]|nr:hypothetical protein [Candidatus Parcubacteria bacterium]